MRAVRVVPGMSAVLVSLVAIAVAGCGPNASSSSAATATSPPASTGASASAGSSAAPSATTASSSAAVQNLIATAAVKSALLTAWAAAKGIPVSDVAGSPPGGVYYAYDPSTGIYWAMADYEPASTDSLNVKVGFQDGGSGGLFKKTGSGPWQVTSEGEPAICDELKFFPASVLVAWNQPTTATPASMC